MMRGNLPVGAVGGGSRPSSLFERFASATSRVTGKPVTFLLATSVVAFWAITGPIFHYSDTWQLVINTGTTIITFLMVFLIQATQNRDTVALQLKLDELIFATNGARDEMACIEDEPENRLEEEKRRVQQRAHH